MWIKVVRDYIVSITVGYILCWGCFNLYCGSLYCFVMCVCVGFVMCGCVCVFRNSVGVCMCGCLVEVFPCSFLSCKATARVTLAKTGHGPHSSKLVVICVVLCTVCV